MSPKDNTGMTGRKIDVHTHAFPSELWEQLSKLVPDYYRMERSPDGKGLIGLTGGGVQPAWDHEYRLQEIDKAGVSVQILSCPLLYGKTDSHFAEMCILLNDIYAETCRRSPDRFRAFAHLPFHDPDAAMRELARCVDELGFVGVAIDSNIGGRYLDAPEYDWFWGEVERRRLPVHMHPISSPSYKDVFAPALLTYPFDTTLAVARLVLSGMYERHPDVILIASHLGGALPYLAYRLDFGAGRHGNSPWDPLPNPPLHYMKKLYLDTATTWSKGTFYCARELVGIDHILLGTDYFIHGTDWMQRILAFFDDLDLIAPAERQKIYHENSERIFDLKI